MELDAVDRNEHVLHLQRLRAQVMASLNQGQEVGHEQALYILNNVVFSEAIGNMHNIHILKRQLEQYEDTMDSLHERIGALESKVAALEQGR